MQTRPFPPIPDARSPAGAEIRYLIEGETGNMIHSTVTPGQVNRATVHATVNEFWHVLSGEGLLWRRDSTGEETTVLRRGISIDIPVGTAFQYRCTGDVPLRFLCISMPRWPGDEEASVIEGPWESTAPEQRGLEDVVCVTPELDTRPRGDGDKKERDRDTCDG
jgi:mannose-6-phosphate isomerase-like protein (cupin superfamily)